MCLANDQNGSLVQSPYLETRVVTQSCLNLDERKLARTIFLTEQWGDPCRASQADLGQADPRLTDIVSFLEILGDRACLGDRLGTGLQFTVLCAQDI